MYFVRLWVISLVTTTTAKKMANISRLEKAYESPAGHPSHSTSQKQAEEDAALSTWKHAKTERKRFARKAHHTPYRHPSTKS